MANFLKPGVDVEQLKIQESEALLMNLASQRARLLMMQDKELEAGNAQAVATLAGRIHQNLEIVGKYLGEPEKCGRSVSLSQTADDASCTRTRAEHVATHPELVSPNSRRNGPRKAPWYLGDSRD